MPGRLAIDFGTSNTVIAVWDETQQAGIPLDVRDYGDLDTFGQDRMTIVPSLIHYADAKQTWIGKQVFEKPLTPPFNLRTFRDMKRYISTRSQVSRSLDGRQITMAHAGRDFLLAVLGFAKTELDIGDEEVVFTVPVESYEHYVDWLADVAEAAGMPRFRLIDEPSAAALGYAANIQPNDIYLVFDFGGGTLDVAVVIIEEPGQTNVGRRCRVLGKGGAELGGTVIDDWIYQSVLKKNGLDAADEGVLKITDDLLRECEKLKKRLSFVDRADLSVINPETGSVIAAEFTESELANLLDENGAFRKINETFFKALKRAAELGYDEMSVKSVLMVGGSSLIPSVQRLVKQRFGSEKVLLTRPMDAVARGGAAFVAGVDFYDHIQHDYAIRTVSPKTGQYDYRVIVRSGTPYPSNKPIDRLTIKATYEGQSELGVAIFEMGENRYNRGHQAVELVFDPTGAARVVNVSADEAERRTLFWMNETTPTFLRPEPAAKAGEACFQVDFEIDGNKRLLITARDIRTGRLTHKDHPVIKLT